MSSPIGQPRLRLPAQVKAGDVIEIRTLITHVMETGQRRAPEGQAIPRDIIKRFEMCLGEAPGRLSHITGEAFPAESGLARATPFAHALTDLDVADLARRFGPIGGADRVTALTKGLGFPFLASNIQDRE